MINFEYRTRRVELPEGAIQTYSFGSGEKVVFAFPSFPHSGLLYLLFTRHFDSSKYTFITFDLPGWAGWSDRSYLQPEKSERRITLDEYVDIADAVLTSYQVKSFRIIGYSFGGNLALRLAIRHPEQVNRVVLVSAVLFGNLLKGTKAYRLLRIGRLLKLHKILERRLIKGFVTAAKQVKLDSGDSIIDLYGAMYKQIHAPSLMECLNALFEDSGEDLVKKINSIPHLLVINSRDEDNMFRKQAERIRRIVDHEKTLFLNGSHNDFLVNPSLKNVKQVMRFLLAD